MAAATPGSCFQAAAAAMPMRLLVLAAMITAAAWSVSSTAEMLNGSSCMAAERDALLSFKAGITSDPSRRLRSWRGGQDCCRWYGVRCSTRTGHVVKLDLRNDFFIGDLSGQDHVPRWLRGQISSSLLLLHHVKHLDLSGNVLGGHMPIPKFIGSLKSLTYLDLSNMNFSGRVPPQLGNLTKLVYLDIHTDYFFPYAYGVASADAYAYASYSSDVSWLASLHSLEYLDMRFVDLSAAVDWVLSVNTLPNLRALYLSNCRLNSSIPSLLDRNLTVLEKLDLHNNPFKSPATPNWYWDVTSLKSLDIFGCELFGPFPDELGNLTILETFYIGDNNFKGMIPSTLKNLCNLQRIHLGNTNIGGDIKYVIERLPNCSKNNLQLLSLEEANITGTTIESVLNLTTLSMLDISHNYLSGYVPVEIGKLKNLTYLYINDNNLSGVISKGHFSSLKNLKVISLSRNNLGFMVDSDWEPPFNLDSVFLSSCHLGTQVPNWLQWQKGILNLDISATGLTGRIPDWFWMTFSNALLLDLSYNKISGELPFNLEFMSVVELLLQSNNFTGSIPKLPRNIEVLDISNNSLNGQLPSNFGAPYLHVAILFSNSITGIIPESICRLRKLQILDLSNNLLVRGLPYCGRKEFKPWDPSSNNTSMVNSKGSYSLELHTLLLNNNNLSGGFPLFLKQCKNIMFLDLTQNIFCGKLPGWISEYMPRLVMLRLRSNNFSGHIPIETTRLSNLRILDVANNRFSGAIPQPLADLKSLTTTFVASDPIDNPFQEVYQFGYMFYYIGISDDSLSLVTKGQVLDYRENAIYLMSIDLSNNRLAGQIPEEIGSLFGLINLNLSSNLLSGNIPYTIGNLQALESLDLSNNQLSSRIPWCLSNLTLLSYLNLSYNNLSGRIPSGNQLDTLEAHDPTSIYFGNPGLCGYPLPKVCPGDEPLHEDPFKWNEDGKTQMDFDLGLTVGFLLGLWIVFCVLLFKRTWRYTYFSIFDKCITRCGFFFMHLAAMVQEVMYKLSKHYT